MYAKVHNCPCDIIGGILQMNLLLRILCERVESFEDVHTHRSDAEGYAIIIKLMEHRFSISLQPYYSTTRCPKKNHLN